MASYLEAQGRDRVIFSLLNNADDDLKISAMECLSKVPTSNLQPDEIKELVQFVHDKCDTYQVYVGRNEELMMHAFNAFARLVKVPDRPESKVRGQPRTSDDNVMLAAADCPNHDGRASVSGRMANLGVSRRAHTSAATTPTSCRSRCCTRISIESARPLLTTSSLADGATWCRPLSAQTARAELAA